MRLMQIVLLIVCFSGVGWALPVLGAQPAQEKALSLMYSTFFPAKEVHAQLADAWAREIEKRSQGRVKINFIPGGTYLQAEDIYEGVLRGATDIGMSAFAYNRNQFPVMEAIDLPMGYPTGRGATAIINAFYKKFQPAELSKVKVLYLHAHGPGLLHSKKPVHRLEDLKGMRIRATGFATNVVRALGATAMIKPQGYTFVLLQDGYVDATFSPMEVLKEWNQAEVIKYTIETNGIAYTTGFYVAMNVKKWNALSKDLQKVFEEVSLEWTAKHGEAWDAGDAEGRTYTLSFGNEIITLSETEKTRWGKATEPVIRDYTRRIEKKGLPAKKYLDTLSDLIRTLGKPKP
jgi:TRAP-type transport system periplasmic protein